jgi:hypothetical protein
MAGVSGGKTVSASYGAAQTNIPLVAVPAAGSRIVVHWACLANGATNAGDMKLLDGAVINVAGPISNTLASPTVVTCGVYVPTGTTVTIAGSNSDPVINGTYVATNVDATRFSIPVAVTTAGTAGTVVTASGYGSVLAAALLQVNTPMHFDGSRAPLVLSAATPLCFTSVTATTHRVNVGYSIES